MLRTALGRVLGSSALAFLLAALAAPDAGALTPNLRIESNVAGAQFGTSMANAGDVNGDGIDDLIVGATDWDETGNANDYGAVFLFLGRAGGLQTGDLSQADTRIVGEQIGARLGTSVGSAGDVNGDGYGDVIVGAGGWDGGQDNEGAAFIYLGGPNGIPNGNLASAATVLQGDRVNARLGTSVGYADINGDGYDDVITGGRLFQSDVNSTEEGYALIFLGSATGVANAGRLTAHALIESDQPGAHLGEALAGVGDVNNDGYEDVLIGSPRWSNPNVREGGAFLYLGSATGIASGNPSTANARLESQQTDARFGRSMIGLGDINGDGFDDVAISATQYDNGQADEGATFVYLGSAQGLVTSLGGTDLGPGDALAMFESDQTDVDFQDREYFGFGLDRGDWNADGHTDLLISSPYYDGTLDEEGAAFLFLGHEDGFTSAHAANADRIFLSNVRSAWMGSSVALLDFDDDGLGDVFVGANRLSNPIAEESVEGMLLGFPRIAACENGADDDGDLAIDLADVGCATAGDAREEIDFVNGFPNAVNDARADTVLARDSSAGAATTVTLDVGGSTARDLVAIDSSSVVLAGGSVAGDLIASDSSTAEITSGSVAGAVIANGAATIVIRGGTVVAIEAHDTSLIEIHGLAFALPDGDVAAFSGSITGTLEDGTPIDATFDRDSGATIRLVPEPGAAAVTLAALGSLAALRRRARSA